VLCEQHAFRCQLIQVRRFDFLLSVTAKLPVTEIISVDINNIWPVRMKWNTALKDAYTGSEIAVIPLILFINGCFLRVKVI
jgi:hypothetical protein